MTIEYRIDEQDMLTFQLFVASKSDRIRKRRRKSRLLGPIIYFVLGLVFLFLEREGLTVSFILFGILWFLFYPVLERRRYVKHYRSFVKEHFENRLDRTITAQFDPEHIIIKDNGSESKILTKEIEEIHEIASAIYIKMKTGQALTLPKNKIQNVTSLTTWLKALVEELQVVYATDEKWKWK